MFCTFSITPVSVENVPNESLCSFRFRVKFFDVSQSTLKKFVLETPASLINSTVWYGTSFVVFEQKISLSPVKLFKKRLLSSSHGNFKASNGWLER